jgi:LPS-assembly protein
MLRIGQIILLVFLSFSFIKNSYSAVKISDKSEQSLPSVLKADKVNSDENDQTLTAIGNVELRKDFSVIKANEMIYDKKTRFVKAVGEIKINNLEIGKVDAKDAVVKDDFSSAIFYDSTMIMNDGSYLISPKINRENPQITILDSAIYSLCPNPEISDNNEIIGKKRDLLSIKTKKTTIDRENQKFTINHGIVRIYNFPVLYTPYLKSTFPSKERESGFLTPSYVRNVNGFGVNFPYYINIAKNKDLTITPYINPGQSLYVVKNDFRHLTPYGSYQITPEIANNNIEFSRDSTIVSRTQSNYRWNLKGSGKFDFTTNTGLDFEINDVYDRNYLRDYRNDFVGFTMSKANLDYIYRRDYYAIKAIKFQELENAEIEKSAPLILPIIENRIESKPFFFNEKIALSSNIAVLKRTDGLQYRRLTAIPEVSVPFNLKGNLFKINSNIQADYYSFEDNFSQSVNNRNYDSEVINYRPETSINWSLPLVKKGKEQSFLLEPMANLVYSSFKRNADEIANEDSENPELTFSNLFISDRISGFDRNESGTRTTYGIKSSYINKYGDLGFNIGQSFRIKNNVQDVDIRGFNQNDKSNYVGLITYRSKKYFNLYYAYQLNESSLRNDVNEVNALLYFDKISFNVNYLLLRRSSQNEQKREQATFSSTAKISEKTSTTISATRDLFTGRVLMKSIALSYNGCCTIFNFTFTQNNQSNLTTPSNSYSVNLTFKNL